MSKEMNTPDVSEEGSGRRPFWDLRGHLSDSGNVVANAMDERIRKTGFEFLEESERRLKKLTTEFLEDGEDRTGRQREKLVGDFETACARQREAFWGDAEKTAQKILDDIDEKLTRRADEEVKTALKLFGIMASMVAVVGLVSLLFAWLHKAV